MAVPKIRRRLYGPNHPLGPSVGRDVRDFVKRTLHRVAYLEGFGEDFFPVPPAGFDKVYNLKTVEAINVLRHLEGREQGRPFAQDDLDSLWPRADKFARYSYLAYVPLPPKPKVPDLGPIYPGGASVLYHSLTHGTHGFPNAQHPASCYPAFDDGWRAGRAVLAPEDLEVTEQSSAAGGDAFFAEGKSKLEYWFGHLVWAPSTGSEFEKGQTMGVIANLSASQGSPHVHMGINAFPLIGHEFVHKTNYQTGAPSVGEQLRWALA